MTPIFASKRLDWSSAIGLFIINYGVLDWHVFVFLELRMSPDQFSKTKNEGLKDRIARIETLMNNSGFSDKQRRAFAQFFQRLNPIRELRNHIAHGHLLVRLAEDGKSLVLTLSLPKNLDAVDGSESRHLEFEELAKALAELTELIEEFKKLSGLWSNEELRDLDSTPHP